MIPSDERGSTLARNPCPAWVEHPIDPWGGSYCKFAAHHDGPHSAHFRANSKHDAACLARRTTQQNRLVCSCGMSDAEVDAARPGQQ